jgi:hypothetical protein
MPEASDKKMEQFQSQYPQWRSLIRGNNDDYNPNC